MQNPGTDNFARNDAADRIATVTSESFDALVLNGQGPIVVEFMSYSCSHCAQIEPVLQQLAERLQSQETILRVNTGLESALSEQYQITGTPTLVMFLDGAEVGRAEGPPPELSRLMDVVTEPFES